MKDIYKVILFLSSFVYFISQDTPLKKEEVMMNSDDSSLSTNKIISLNDFFNMPNQTYYVLVYLDGCMACRDVKLVISLTELDYEIYYLNFLSIDMELKKEEKSNIGVSDINELHISLVPHFFLIENQEVKNEWIGSKDILSYLR